MTGNLHLLCSLAVMHGSTADDWRLAKFFAWLAIVCLGLATVMGFSLFLRGWSIGLPLGLANGIILSMYARLGALRLSRMELPA